MDRKKIGFALGGGGARGLAHIGILKVLERERIPIDFLSGSSMGGLIAAVYGAGISAEILEAEAMELANPRKLMRLMDVNPLRRGLLEGKRVRSYLVNRFGLDIQFDQLHIPVSLTATDYWRGESVIINQGSVIDAVMATCAFPGMFHAVRIGDRWLLDGGMLNNVPGTVVRKMGAQVVVAIDVTTSPPITEIPKELEHIHRLPPIFPQLIEDIYQAVMIMTSEITRIRYEESPPDLVINPSLPDDYSIFLGFFRASEAIAAGEAAASQFLPEIIRLVEKDPYG
jgi:NTE family protein